MATSTCFSCDGRCCRSHVVPLTGADVRRILDAGQSLMSFTDFVSVAELESTHHDVALDDGYHYLVVKRVDDTCVFLEDGRCSIHEHKPLLCRMYPFFHSSSKGVVPRTPYRCRHLPTLPQGEKESFHALWQSYEKEKEDFDTFVQEWNTSAGKGRTKSSFLEALLDTS